MTPDEKLKDILAAIFSRRGIETNRTWLWDNAPGPIRDECVLFAGLENELPVVVSKLRANYSLIVTTRRTIVRDNYGIVQISNNAVIAANIHILTGSPASIQPKSEVRQLHLKEKNGSESVIEVEEGKPLIGIWNVFMHIAMLNKKLRIS